jgi:hypothetical protein
MRSFRQIATAALITIGVFSVIAYTSCSKSSSDANSTFLGTYSASEICSPPDSSGTWTSVITASSTGSTGIVISNFGNSTTSINGTVDSKGNLTLTSATIGGYTVSGTGILSGNTLTITYAGAGTNPFTCTMTMHKQ